jgi:type I restriction enzyme, S subunit
MSGQKVPKGYKQTEVGVIPEDWVLTPLSTLGQFKNGINKGSEAFGHGHPFVNLMNVFGVSSILSAELLDLVETNYTERQNYDLRKGDVLFIRSSVKPSGVGLTALIEKDLPETVYSGFLIRFRDGGSIDKEYKQHCFYEEGFRKRLISASSVSANTNINQDNLKQLLIALPPTQAEQKLIARALSDIDALIEGLEGTIGKKRHIKQGAMQELLTGKRRLKGFGDGKKYQQAEIGLIPEDWSYDSLNGKIELLSGRHILAEQYNTENDGVPYLTGPSDFRENRSEISKWTNAIGVKANNGDILVTVKGSGSGSSFLLDLFEAIISRQLMAVRGVKVSQMYLFYVLKSKELELSSKAVGNLIPGLSRNDLLNQKILFPSQQEQQAIATILSDMDTEITTLEAKLTKTCQLKQGMMHELLTGRVRLV